MNHFRLVIEPGALGLHARPSHLLTNAFGGSDCRAHLTHAGQQVDITGGGNLLMVLALAVCQGSKFEVTCDGADAGAVLGRLRRLFSEHKDFEGFSVWEGS